MNREEKTMRGEFRVRSSWLISACALGAALLCGLPLSLHAQSCLPYSQFMAMAQPSDMEVKLTYVGIQDDPVETVLFTSTVENPGGLAYCHIPSAFYGNDLLGFRTFTATSQQMTNVLQLAGQIPAVQHGNASIQGQFLSFALFSPASRSSGIGYEVILRSEDAGSLLNAMRAALSDNPMGLRTINELGCDLDLPAPGTPADVTSDFAIKFSSFNLDPITGYYVGTVTLTNDSPNGIAGPVSLVINVSPDQPLVNADGYTCHVTAIGRPFLQLPLSGGLFPPGETIQLAVQFLNPSNALLPPTAQVLAGAGAR
jgi:hypothetical protein